jgi:hypothetical protein
MANNRARYIIFVDEAQTKLRDRNENNSAIKIFVFIPLMRLANDSVVNVAKLPVVRKLLRLTQKVILLIAIVDEIQWLHRHLLG